MITGELRKSILENCPEDFEEELIDFINNLENSIKDISRYLDIESISEISNIEDAYTLSQDLADGLY